MAQIIDLDSVLPPDKKVKLKGKTYVLPPDLPVELFLRINQFADGDADEHIVKKLYDEILGLFRYGDPSIETLPLSMTQLVTAISMIYGEQQEPDAARPSRAGTTSTRARKKTRSGS